MRHTPCAKCSICGDRLEGERALCHPCSVRIGAPERRAPGVVRSKVPVESAAAWLIDAWGQFHPVSKRCRIGRDEELNELVLTDLFVSAEHAEMKQQNGAWILRDRGSVNGTGKGDGSRIVQTAIEHGEIVWFGPIAFYWWAKPAPFEEVLPLPPVETLARQSTVFRLFSETKGECFARPARGHLPDRGPGELEYLGLGSQRSTIVLAPRLQFQLLRVLCEARARAIIERETFVPTQELARILPFMTAYPEPNHVRQVVAGLRAKLQQAGLPGGGENDAGGVIHAVEGLGYRLSWNVQCLRESQP